VASEFIDEGEDAIFDRIVAAIESVPVPPAEPPPSTD
jgi:hypothetical protein